MSFLPKTRGGVIWRALVAAILVVGFAAGATATAGLLQVNTIVRFIGQHATVVKGLQKLPPPGKPETLLLIGSDHRAGSGNYTGSNTDTMLLMRIDDSSSTINLLSVPRDLEVLDANGAPTKLNAIYEDQGGPSGLLQVLKAQVFPNLQVTHVIDTNFTGFSDLIDAIGCVYTDVDHRYYNVTEPAPSADNYSSIDIQPGYQKLCGGVHNANGYGALAFVRFRHTDSDETRNARQQDFIRWAKDGYSSSQLVSNRNRLLKIFGKYTTPDKSLASTPGLLDLFGLVVNASKLSLKTIQFPEYFGQNVPGAPDYVYPCPETSDCPPGQPTPATEAAWNAFITPTAAKSTSSSTASGSSSRPNKPKRVKETIDTAGLEADPGDGASQAAQLKNVGFPIFYPKYIVGQSDYCFTITENCDNLDENTAGYVGSYPRRYRIVGPHNTPEDAYVMTLDLNSELGEYYTVQGTVWKDPPILNKPSKVVHIKGHELYEYDDGGKISLVATKTDKAVYWVSNTLNNAIGNTAMIAMAAELTRYTGKA
jgi:LCP family protein required for cell wall assembly